MPNQPRRPAFFWLVLAACPVYAIAFALTILAFVHHYGTAKAPGWSVRSERAGWLVAEVDSNGPAAGRLQKGDRLLALNGDERSAVIGVSYWRNVPGDTPYRVDVERHGQRLAVELPLPLVHARSPTDIVFALYALVFFVCGAALGLLRPRDCAC